ncbi:toll-like receptor 2 isoform X2 [Labrus mixtus]|uniref:toll-like receptor 2 isoform X2 n=1 Tax=Labrus mixtus TaxID=508554 RepID=UPI0029C0A396|nr:toll-like receptor 2 isoform X2 [Labrus mixtus]
MTLMTYLMFVLLMHQSFSSSRPQCHSCEPTSCDCSRQNLSDVPAAPSKLITELNLSFNMLKTIRHSDFDSYASLQSLIMNNNEINAIHEQAFVKLATLEKLDLSFNRLEILSAGWFKNLYSLQHLNLLGNTYKMLGQGNLFEPLKRLKSLCFGGPNFLYLRKSDFSGLSHLEEVVFHGPNLQDYGEGSLRQIGPIQFITLNLNFPFLTESSLVETILSDVVHANTTLTFTDTGFFTTAQLLPFHVVSESGTRRIVFKNMTMTFAAVLALIDQLSDSNITMFTLEDITLFLSFEFFFIDRLNFEHLEEVVFKNIDIPQFYGFPAPNFLEPLLKVVRRVSVVNCDVFAIPCESSVLFSQTEYLDLSENYFTDLALSKLMCDGQGVLQSLRTLNVSRNHLLVINSRIFSKLEKLENIDISGNKFDSTPESCYWPPSLQFFNLSSSRLTKVTACLPVSLRILDLSHNALTVFNIELPFLTDLYISGNKLRSLPDGGFYPHLAVLSIQNNDLHTLSRDILNGYDNLKSLEASSDTYVCSCDFVAFMTSDPTNHRVTIVDEFKSYICDSPDAERGQSVGDVRLSVFECHTALAFSLLCLVIVAVILLIAGLCFKFNIFWYLKMTWTWLRAKRKPKLKKGQLEFDAFVSYSEMDSGWVDAHLIPELEQAEPHLRLCLHKRDFIAGGWILDNIMDAIERSHRTLFVISQHFVMSEWCKYELDYTHFRLFDHNVDTVVLILLEPIDKNSIPKKFCKLRRVMNSRTYLEWPDDDDQIPRFWQSLRTAIMRPEADDRVIDTVA